MDIEKHIEAIALLRRGADLLHKSDDEVHLPDEKIIVSDGKVFLEAGEFERGQDIRESKLADLIRYFADMIGD